MKKSKIGERIGKAKAFARLNITTTVGEVISLFFSTLAIEEK